MEADAEHRTAMTLFQKLADDNPAVTNFQSGLMVSHGLLGLLLSTTDKPSVAEAEFRAALVIQEKLADDDPTVTDGPSSVGQYHANIGEMLLQMGKPGRRRPSVARRVAIQQKLADDNPAVPIFRDRLAVALTYLGDVVRSNGRAAEAKGCYDRAIALKEPQLKEDPTDTLHRYYLACAMRRAGWPSAISATPPARPPILGGRWTVATGCRRRSTRAGSRRPAAARRSRAWPGRPARECRSAEGEDAAAKAMEWLGRAVAMGYRNTNQLRIESALDPLRNRPDFKKLMAELEKNAPPQQEKK